MFVWWKSADEWANDVHRFALRTGEVEVVETVNYFQTEAGSPVLAMAEEVILRISQTVRCRAAFCLLRATSSLSLVFVYPLLLQLVGKNKALIMASDSGDFRFEASSIWRHSLLPTSLQNFALTVRMPQVQLVFDFTDNNACTTQTGSRAFAAYIQWFRALQMLTEQTNHASIDRISLQQRRPSHLTAAPTLVHYCGPAAIRPQIAKSCAYRRTSCEIVRILKRAARRAAYLPSVCSYLRKVTRE